MARHYASPVIASETKRAARPKSTRSRVEKKPPASKKGRTNQRNGVEPSNALATALRQSVDAAIQPNLESYSNIDPNLENYSIQASATSFNANNPYYDQPYSVLDEDATPEERAAFVGYAEVKVDDSNGRNNLASQDHLTRSPAPEYDFIKDYYFSPFIDDNFNITSKQDNIRVAAAAALATMDRLRNSKSGIAPSQSTAAVPDHINSTAMTKREAEAAAVPEQRRRPRPEMPPGRLTHLIKLETPTSFTRIIPIVVDAKIQAACGKAEFETKARTEEGYFRTNVRGLSMFLWEFTSDRAGKVEDNIESDTFNFIKYTAAANLPEFNVKRFDREEGAPQAIRFRLGRLYYRIIASQYGFWDDIQPEQLRYACELEVRKWVMETLVALKKKCAQEAEKARPLNNKSLEHIQIIH